MPHAMWVSIESGATGAGIPDAYFCFEYRKMGWIEYKQCAVNAVKISPLQVAWHSQHSRKGGRSYIAVRRKDELHIYPSSEARNISTGGIKTATAMGVWRGGPSKWNWAAIEEILTA